MAEMTTCYFFHDWEKWTTKAEHNVTRVTSDLVIGKITIQERTCKTCNFKEQHVIKHDLI
jgi:hypothetical protein